MFNIVSHTGSWCQTSGLMLRAVRGHHADHIQLLLGAVRPILREIRPFEISLYIIIWVDLWRMCPCLPDRITPLYLCESSRGIMDNKSEGRQGPISVIATFQGLHLGHFVCLFILQLPAQQHCCTAPGCNEVIFGARIAQPIQLSQQLEAEICNSVSDWPETALELYMSTASCLAPRIFGGNPFWRETWV